MKKLLILSTIILTTSFSFSIFTMQHTKKSYDISKEVNECSSLKKNTPSQELSRSKRCYDLRTLEKFQVFQRKLNLEIEKENFPVPQKPEFSVFLTTTTGEIITLLNNQSI